LFGFLEHPVAMSKRIAKKSSIPATETVVSGKDSSSSALDLVSTAGGSGNKVEALSNSEGLPISLCDIEGASDYIHTLPRWANAQQHDVSALIESERDAFCRALFVLFQEDEADTVLASLIKHPKSLWLKTAHLKINIYTTQICFGF
jgi:hypothetical protein